MRSFPEGDSQLGVGVGVGVVADPSISAARQLLRPDSAFTELAGAAEASPV